MNIPSLAQFANAEEGSRRRAIIKYAQKLRRELAVLKPHMHNEGSYKNLQRKYPQFYVFKIAERDEDVKLWVANIQERRRVEGLADEIAGRHLRIKAESVRKYWSYRSRRPH